MSAQVLVAHTGERLLADPVSLGSLDTFKAWLAKAVSIPPANQILLTSTGKQVRSQALLTEREIFVYNRQLISPSATSTKSQVPLIPLPPRCSPETPPDTLSNQNDLKAWKNLFKARRAWVGGLAGNCRALSDDAIKHFAAFNTIERGLNVALGNLDSHVRSLEQKYGEAENWSVQVAQEQEEALAALETTLSKLGSIPANGDFLRLVSPNGDRSLESEDVTLQEFVRPQDLKEADVVVTKGRKAIKDRISELGKSVSKVVSNSKELISAIQERNSRSILDSGKASLELMEEVDVIVKKISSDHEYVSGLNSVQKAVSQASKMALLHTRNYLPTLKEYGDEMVEILEQAINRRNDSASAALDYMRQIVSIEAAFAGVNAKILSLDVPSESAAAFDRISLVSQLPSIYGSLLMEAVRRREWTDRIRGESSILAEDIASYKEEEERRRKKWLKGIGHLINTDAAKGEALKFELNLQADDQEWPAVSREDIAKYVTSIQALPGMEDAMAEIANGIKDLDRPTKRQIKKAKTFKAGSVHEAAFGKGSFLFREGDEVLILKDSNARLEDELRGQKSRVRKLEDLLHKQNQSSRTSSANMFRAPDGQPEEPSTPDGTGYSPMTRDLGSRRSSLTPRRVSATRSAEEKNLARRILGLESDLMTERNKREELEKHVSTGEGTETKMKTEIEEAQAIKRDLMENMEAQQGEFAAERQLLEEEIRTYKLKLEEAEEELDRILGSRDNEKLGHDKRLQAVEQDHEHTKKTLKSFQDQAVEQRETQELYMANLRGIHAKVAQGGSPPSNETDLINALDTLVERSVLHSQELAEALALAQSEKQSLQYDLSEQDTEASKLRSRTQSLEEQITSLRDHTSEEQAKTQSLTAELEDGRSQLRLLRAKFAEGETGSESLRLRVEEQSARASQLASDLAASKSHTNSLDVELLSMQRKQRSLQTELTGANEKLDDRSSKARDLSQRLASQRRELLRLLDNLGLVVIYRDSSMVIQRASKLASTNTSAVLAEPFASGRATSPPAAITGNSTLHTSLEDSIDPSLLQWPHDRDPAASSEKYTAFLSKLTAFDISAFSEAIVKLRRDIEWTGMKWKKEARAYRDKYHRTQSEAHDKIAFRAFKEGDLALFLPTRNQATRPWAAFNVGAPHYFLREQDSHKLRNREWLVARISRLEERVVDLSKPVVSTYAPPDDESASTVADDDNPFELSDGLRWYLLDAAEEKAGAPSTPGLGKSTVASAHVDVKGSIRMVKKAGSGSGTADVSTKLLNKSLDSRRSSSNSKKGADATGTSPTTAQAHLQQPQGDAAAAAAAGGSRRSSISHLRPTSRSSATGGAITSPRAVGLAIENSNSSVVGRAPAGGTDEYLARASPARSSLLGFMTGAKAPSSSSSAAAAAAAAAATTTEGHHASLAKTLPRDRGSAVSLAREASDVNTARSTDASPAKKSAASAASAAAGIAAASPTKGSSSGAEPGLGPAARHGVWDSLWSLDVSVEGGAKGKK